MEDFFRNSSRYPRYLISLILGIFFFAWEKIKPLFQSPTTATAIVGLLVGGFFFLYFTLKAMLGKNPV